MPYLMIKVLTITTGTRAKENHQFNHEALAAILVAPEDSARYMSRTLATIHRSDVTVRIDT